jgi:photosystem II stability/assembly factor-like uncharacterized protein
MRPNCTLLQFAAIVVISLLLTNTLQSQWSHTPGATGGFAAALFSDSQFMLFGLEQGGVYRSIDDGVTWQPVFNGLTGRGPGAYAFARTGTRVFLSTGVGIAMSTDQGLTWNPANNGLPSLGSSISDFAVRSTGTIFAAGSEGVYRSNDSGGTWIKGTAGLTDSLMSSLLSTPTYLFAGTYESGIFRSTNDGVTWQLASTGLPSGSGHQISALTTVVGGRLLAATRAGMYYSTDSGDSWTQAASGLDTRTVSTVFAIDTILVAGTYGFGAYRSTDKGSNWISASTGWPSGNVRAFCTHKGVLYGGSYGFSTLYKSTDIGQTWVEVGNGITSRLPYALAVNNTRVFAAEAYGLEISSDGGSTWNTPALLFGKSYYSVHSKGSLIYAGSSSIGPYLSTDNGVTWDTANGWNSGTGPHATISLNTDSLYLYAGAYNGTYRSSDNGTSWTSLHGGLTDTIVYTICPAKGHVFAGTQTGIFVSTDHGTTWSVLSGGAPTYHIKSIVNIDSVVLAATEYGSVPSTFRSTNYGQSWSPVTDGLTSLNAVFQTLLVDGRSIFAGSATEGVWLSTDLGLSWSNISSGLYGPAQRIVGLAVSDHTLFALTRGGIWTRPLTQVVAVDQGENPLPTKMELMQNYPNPFNPSTVIKYDVGVVSGQSPAPRSTAGPVVSNVRLAVYDLLGREVAVLVNEKREPGRYELVFDGSRLPSGVYIYRLEAGSTVASRKMMLLK